MPFFSIIIPTYNRACIIRRPIDSIIAQTFTDWELIIVDDGSTDHTQEIVDSYNDSRIKYIWQENQERSAARNHGITLATGIWLCFQDSDDEYLPEHLQVLFEGIQAFPEYKIIRTGLHIYENERYIGKSGIQSINKYDQFPYECIHVHSFKSEIVKTYKFNSDFITIEDFYFLFTIVNKYNVLHLKGDWTGKHYYDATSSGCVGINYERNINFRIACMDFIINNGRENIIPYVYRQRCLSEILMLKGHFQYQSKKIKFGIMQNIRCLFRFPLEYTKLICRIIYVKIGEWSGLYSTTFRF